MSKNKFETLIEYIINDDEAKAKALFHKIVIEKSRDIYESLNDEDEAVPSSQEIEGLEDEISGDETGETSEFDAEDELDDQETAFDDETTNAGNEEGLDDRVMDLEDAIDELRAEFDALMAEEETEPEHQDDDEFATGDDELDADEEVDVDDEEVADDEPKESTSIYGESRGQRKSPSDLMREYVEKVTVSKPVEGDAVGAGGTKTPINAKSTTIGGKNDMGGSSKNIAQGGSEQVPTGPKKPSNAYAKGEKKMGQDKYENSPGANTKGYSDKKSAPVKKEESAVNDTSIVGESRRARKPAVRKG